MFTNSSVPYMVIGMGIISIRWFIYMTQEIDIVSLPNSNVFLSLREQCHMLYRPFLIEFQTILKVFLYQDLNYLSNVR